MSDIKFYEESHTYVHEKFGNLISVSKFIEKFKKKTDWNKVAKKKAITLTNEGTPTTQEELLQKWEEKRIFSTEVGTLAHKIEEDKLNEDFTHENEIFNIVNCPSTEEFKLSLDITALEDNTVYPELMLYDLEHMICGQSDKVIIKNKFIDIWDYKTDKELEYVGYYSQWAGVKKLLAPVNHLDECNVNIYSLKMSLYMYMLWKANKGKLKPGKIILEHIHLLRDPERDNIPVLVEGKPVEIKRELITLPYRKNEVLAMLKTIKT